MRTAASPSADVSGTTNEPSLYVEGASWAITLVAMPGARTQYDANGRSNSSTPQTCDRKAAASMSVRASGTVSQRYVASWATLDIDNINKSNPAKVE